MEIIIERIVMGLVKNKKTVKLPKGRLLVTIGDKKFIVNNTGETPKVDRIESDREDIQTYFPDNM